MNLSMFGGLAAVAFLAASAVAAQPPAPSGSVSRNLQGDDSHAWASDPHIHAFYDAVVAACAQGADKADVAALEKTSREIFRAFAISRGASPEAMEDHLKLIPAQIVGIVREDPHVLDTYDGFVEALFGPK